MVVNRYFGRCFGVIISRILWYLEKVFYLTLALVWTAS